MPNKTKFGHVKGSKGAEAWPVGASEVFKSQSARFVKNDGSGRIEIAGASDDYIVGHAESGDKTASATEGADKLNVISALDGVFRIPFIYDGSSYTTNYSDALLGTVVDLVVVSDVQYADLGVTTKGHLRVVGGKAASATASAINDGYVDVKMNIDAVYDA